MKHEVRIESRQVCGDEDDWTIESDTEQYRAAIESLADVQILSTHPALIGLLQPMAVVHDCTQIIVEYVHPDTRALLMGSPVTIVVVDASGNVPPHFHETTWSQARKRCVQLVGPLSWSEFTAERVSSSRPVAGCGVFDLFVTRARD